ncbi:MULTISPECIES: ABC transporter substrate-binding protein [unclassified Beijerinckia]|uniref:ABC transporter substrate-binding protein n=1 Tax=unclassified Beijerinckia TaxID=2638183 RepID=UPI000898E76E|nr:MULTISPECIES: ABC transporter substrate-binding protein [unclassified Beijerinckia]MDH7798824.1 peptide/nickel transport system substrate-binding protein [Beijerinckia sp. GAS462]SED89691.1 peptide/nickel transport system substrate-binding protein [Beijerinckia sp. 28-YEA-48]
MKEPTARVGMFAAGAGLLMAVSTLSACGDNSNATVRVAFGALPAVLDPFQAATPPYSIANRMIYSYVTQVSATAGGKVATAPGIAESWTQVDPTTWEFKLRAGLKFSNGEPLDAAAVKASADYLLNPQNAKGLLGALSMIAKVNVVDATTIRFETNSPDGIFPRRLAALAVVPPKAFSADPKKYMAAPVASGPWKVEKWVPNESLILVPNPDAVAAKPKAQRLEFRAIPEASGRIAALQSGGVDIAQGIPSDQVELLSKNFNIAEKVEPGSWQMTIYQTSGPLNDKRVRQALNYAVDKELLLKTVMGGHGAVSQGQVVPEGVTGYCPDVKAYPYDPEKAKALLKEAGYGPGDLTFDFQSPTGFVTNDRALAQATAAMLANVGVKTNIKFLELSTFQDAYRDQSKRAPIFAWRLTTAPFMTADLSARWYLTGATTHPTGYSNPQYDKDFATWQSEGEEKGLPALCNGIALVREDAPTLFGLNLPVLYASNKHVSGFELGVEGDPRFESVEDGK